MNRKTKLITKRWIALLLVFTLTVGLLPIRASFVSQASDADIRNPRTVDGVTTWDCVYFGNYWQNDTNGDGKADQSDKKEPIKWRVLSLDGDDAFLLADENLDFRAYHSNRTENITWQESALCKWLNSEFVGDAFSDEEGNAVKTMSEFGGKVYLLSAEEVCNSVYGFDDSEYISDKARQSQTTTYAKAHGDNSDKYDAWWTRTRVNHNGAYPQAINVKGDGAINSWGCTIHFANSCTVRPCLHLDLSSSVWSYAGTVSSDGQVNESSSTPTSTPGPSKRPANNENSSKSQFINILVTGRYEDGQLNSQFKLLKDLKLLKKLPVFKDTETYKDVYFTQKNTKIQGDLAKLSMLASSSAYKKKYAEELMENCKFEIHRYVKKKPTKNKNDTVSYEIGIRKVNDITIVAVWIKGTSGDYEWVSNWNLGKKSTHSGFNKAEKTMNREIKQYLKSKNITLSKNGKTKLWITGHSRGAAIANLYAKRMNKAIEKANVYAYTFATPRVSKSAKEADYENIFNFLNPGDFVTEVPPKKWGYERYGVDKVLLAKKKNAMKKMFKKKSGIKYNGFGKKGKESLLKAFKNYAGANSKSYYKKKLGYSPAYFCKEGLGYILAGKLSKGLANCLKVCNNSNKAKIVFGKMVVDGKINNKFGYAHTQLGYLCWLKQMY